MYKRMKMKPNFEKGHFRTSKRKKNSLASHMCFSSFSEQTYFLLFFERGYASKCWLHKVFRLGSGHRKSKDNTSHTAKRVRPTKQIWTAKRTLYVTG